MDFDSLSAVKSGLGTAAVIVMDKSTDLKSYLSYLIFINTKVAVNAPCREEQGGCGE